MERLRHKHEHKLSSYANAYACVASDDRALCLACVLLSPLAHKLLLCFNRKWEGDSQEKDNQVGCLRKILRIEKGRVGGGNREKLNWSLSRGFN